MKQNTNLLTAMANNIRGSNGGDGSDGSNGSNGKRNSGGQKCFPTALCPNCNKMVTHKSRNCYSLEANKSKIPHWYKPLKTG